MQNHHNERGAGRKRSLTDEQIALLIQRRDAGEQVGALAKECGVSRQTLSKYLNGHTQSSKMGAGAEPCVYAGLSVGAESSVDIDSCEGAESSAATDPCTDAAEWKRINADFKGINADDYTMRMEFMCQDEVCTVILVDFAAQQIQVQNRTSDVIHRAFGIKVRPTWQDFEEFLEDRCVPRTRDHLDVVLEDYGLDFYDPLAIVEITQGRMAEDAQWIRIWHYAKYVFMQEHKSDDE